jgi:hypothetical protein
VFSSYLIDIAPSFPTKEVRIKPVTVHINQLVELGTIQLPAETFSDPVIVTETEFVWECEVYESEVGADLCDVESGGPVPDHFRPLFDSVKELREERERPI